MLTPTKFRLSLFLGSIWSKVKQKSRGDPTRTGDHLVPNQVRYQLRYTPMLPTRTEKRLQNYCFSANCASFRHTFFPSIAYIIKKMMFY